MNKNGILFFFCTALKKGFECIWITELISFQPIFISCLTAERSLGITTGACVIPGCSQLNLYLCIPSTPLPLSSTHFNAFLLFFRCFENCIILLLWVIYSETNMAIINVHLVPFPLLASFKQVFSRPNILRTRSGYSNELFYYGHRYSGTATLPKLLIEKKSIVSSWVVYIISLLYPPCATLCYLWLIYATLNLALIVNVRGEMSLVTIVPALSSTPSPRSWWFGILTEHRCTVAWQSCLWIRSDTRTATSTSVVKRQRCFYLL